MSFVDALTLFYAALAVSLPTFGWVIVGVLLKRFGVLPEALNRNLSRFAFNVGLPIMLFAGAAQVDYTTLSSARYLLAGILATLLDTGFERALLALARPPATGTGYFCAVCISF